MSTPITKLKSTPHAFVPNPASSLVPRHAGVNALPSLLGRGAIGRASLTEWPDFSARVTGEQVASSCASAEEHLDLRAPPFRPILSSVHSSSSCDPCQRRGRGASRNGCLMTSPERIPRKRSQQPKEQHQQQCLSMPRHALLGWSPWSGRRRGRAWPRRLVRLRKRVFLS